jgi:heme-degrading monooxygenase HmoA
MSQTESSTSSGNRVSGILELALLDVRGKQTQAFEAALSEALPLIRRQPGCRSAEIRPCLESAERYLLLVNWATLADHEQGFRRSDDYKRWRALLHGFYEPFPVVEHYGPPL